MRKELSEGEKLVNRNVKVENQKCDQQLVRLICITGEKFSQGKYEAKMNDSQSSLLDNVSFKSRIWSSRLEVTDTLESHGNIFDI